jgi:hypothetical protein
MDKIREYLKNPLITAAAGIVVGAIFGLIVLGWGLFPITYINATPANLRDDLKVDYLTMAIDSFAKAPDNAVAIQRWKDLGPDAGTVLDTLQSSATKLTPDEITAFRVVVKSQATVPGATPGATSVVTTPTPKPASNNLIIILSVLCLLLVVIGGAIAYILLIRNRTAKGEPTPAMQAQELSKAAERTSYQTQDQEPPIAQFMTTYMAGDDLYDDSFSIDSPSGEFLGECGVGISDTIGVGDPKKVTAFEVWLFDKNDIQTVTQVVMSAHAFNDPAIRQKLESKGEPVLAESGKKILLETATLQLEARIVDLSYGQGALPANSFFERMTLELAIWPKPAQTAPAA